MSYLSRHNLPNNLTATEISHWILKHLVQMGRNGVQISLTSIIFPILQFRNVPYLCAVLRLSLHADSIENDIVDDGLLKHGSRRFFFGHLLADWKPVDIRDGCLKKKKKKRLEEEKNEWRAKWNTSSVATIFHSSGRSIRMRDSGAIRSPFPLQIKEASTAWCHFLWQSLIVSTPRFLFLLFLFIPRNLIMIVRFFLVRVYKEILRKSHAVPIALSFIVISWAGVGENRNLKLILWSSIIRIDN